MLTSKKQFDTIPEKLNTFEAGLSKFGALGLYDLHKASENFMAELLNLVYDYQPVNLNTRTFDSPGLDLGDGRNKIGFQVSTDGSNAKVNDSLQKIITHKIYETFSSVNFFVLGKKLNNYKITIDTSPYFQFSPKGNVQDFTDLNKKIQGSGSEKIQAVYDLIIKEMPDTSQMVTEDASSHTQQAQLTGRLLDIEQLKHQYQTDGYAHCASTIRILATAKRHTGAKLVSTI